VSGHAELSPSAAHRWSRCPGSVEASIGAPRTETEASAEGTLAHEIAAWALRENKPVKAHPRHDPAWGDSLQGYVDRCLEDRCEIWRVEQTLSLAPLFPGQFGTADFWGYQPETRTLIVRDLKFGMGQTVYANYTETVDGVTLIKPNEQLLLYAYGAWLDASMFCEIDEILMVIDQPRRDNTSTLLMTVTSMLQHVHHLSSLAAPILNRLSVLRSAGAQGVYTPPLTRVPGERQCRWCPVRGTCTARADWHLETFRSALDDEPAATPPDQQGETIAGWLRQIPDMEQWINAVRDEATLRLSAGEDCGGWKLVEGRGRRVWTDEAERTLEKVLGAAAFKKTLIGIGDAEKLLGTLVLEDITVKKPGAPTLAPPEDKRPALRLSAADDFSGANPE